MSPPIQPATNRYIINNTVDASRAESPAYIKRFPRLLQALYRKQVPYAPNQSPIHETTPPQISAKVQAAGSIEPKPMSNPRSDRSLPLGFKTMGKIGANNEPNQTASKTSLSQVPSDFEHIFHFSETN